MKSVFRSLIIVFFFFLNISFGQNIPEKPNIVYPVYDEVGLLKPETREQINQKLIAFEKESSTEILVVILPSTNGQDINFFATQWGQKWKIGKEKIDNGVVFMVATKDRKICIQQGRAVETYLTASSAGEIIDYFITPNFKNGNYDAGIQQGVDKIIEALNGKFKANKKSKKPSNDNFVLIIIIFIFIFIIILYLSKNNNGNSNHGGGFLDDDDVILSRRGRGGFGNMWFPTGGSFGSGNSGSGGFGGFGGGGSFGGGGASGGW